MQMYAIIISLVFLLVLEVFSLIIAYNYGKTSNAKDSMHVINSVTMTFTMLMQKVSTGHTEVVELLTKTIADKDTIIASFHKENTELREALEQDSDEVDEDDFEEEGIDEEEATIKLPTIACISDKIQQTSDQLTTARKVLDDVKAKMDTDAFILLASILSPAGKRNVN